jgi:hypothetical protein
MASCWNNNQTMSDPVVGEYVPGPNSCLQPETAQQAAVELQTQQIMQLPYIRYLCNFLQLQAWRQNVELQYESHLSCFSLIFMLHSDLSSYRLLKYFTPPIITVLCVLQWVFVPVNHHQVQLTYLYLIQHITYDHSVKISKCHYHSLMKTKVLSLVTSLA